MDAKYEKGDTVKVEVTNYTHDGIGNLKEEKVERIVTIEKILFIKEAGEPIYQTSYGDYTEKAIISLAHKYYSDKEKLEI